MKYLNERDIMIAGINWLETIEVIQEAVKCLEKNDYSQPIKPYLRYRDKKNRIIAMPAFLGGKINTAGIKWIASFPENIDKGIPRANCMLVLNNASTGEVVAVINTNLISVIRTVSVTGLVMKYCNQIKRLRDFNLGITGWGPIGQQHFNMFMDQYHDKVSNVFLYDIRGIAPETIDERFRDKVTITDKWQEAYENADVFTTCTVSSEPYIDLLPKKGAILMNVSLRDFKPDIYEFVKDNIIVDDWDEVCRENTDIEIMHKLKGLRKEQTANLVDVVCKGHLNKYFIDDAIMFNPMGMGVFDIAIGNYYLEKSNQLNIGTELI